MKARHRIALITTELENTYQQRIVDGVLAQAAKYDYDVAIFSTMLEIAHFMRDNIRGELNIFQLINFDLFDGVLVTPLTLSYDGDNTINDAVCRYLQESCKCKVVSLDMAMGDYETVYTDDASAFYEIAEHIYEVHGCSKVYFLGGFDQEGVPGTRLEGFLRYTEEHGIEMPGDHIFKGDYWYTSGEKLAEDIYSGAVEMPEAVVCASDHMAIGLANRLVKRGIRVPEQVIVTGFDATNEAIFNRVFISTYEAKVSQAAAEMVNRIHRAIEPEAPEEETAGEFASGLRLGESCGCSVDIAFWKQKIDSALLQRKHNWSEVGTEKPSDICVLLESYMSEGTMSALDAEDCIDRIYGYTYLLHPYGDLWICLKENWLDLDDVVKKGYPEQMKVVLHSQGISDTEAAKSVGFGDETGSRVFDTKRMLPEFCEWQGEASVFYFLPVHAREEMYGYAVMRCPLTQKHKIGYVYHNWLRIISNALSMTRIKNQLFELSMKDSVTGLCNRRGLGEWLKAKSGQRKQIFVIMADMDGLKYINDHFGHMEGDVGLISIANALNSVAGKDEISARIGGDEFLLVGVGDFDEAAVKQKISNLESVIREIEEASKKRYEISASLGFALGNMDESFDIDDLIEQADMDMYRNKRRKNKNRQ